MAVASEEVGSEDASIVIKAGHERLTAESIHITAWNSIVDARRMAVC